MILSEQLESSRIKEASALDTHKNSATISTSLNSTVANQKSAKITNGNSNRNIKILKSYYKKDALASVTRSFLSIDENYYKVGQAAANFKELSKLSIGALSIATTVSDSGASDTCSSFNSSCSNKYQNHTLPNDATLNINDASHTTTNNSKTTAEETSPSRNESSCTSFVNQLVADKIKHLNSNNATTTAFQSILNSIPATPTTPIKLTITAAFDQPDNNRSTATPTTTTTRLPHYSASSQNGSVNSSDSDNMSTFQPSLHHSYQLTGSSVAHDNVKLSPHPPPPLPPHNGRELYLLSKKLRKFLPFNYGLKNHGNTCFMNCVLQCLFHTAPLSEYFVTNQQDEDIARIRVHETVQPARFVLTRHFHRLLLSMWNNTYESVYSVQIKSLVGELNPTFAGVNQNDSHEFCVWLLDRLSQELSFKINIVKQVSENGNNGNNNHNENDDYAFI